MKNKINTHLLFLILLCLVGFFVHRNWFQSGILLMGESHYFPKEFFTDSSSMPYLWQGTVDGGRSNIVFLSRHFLRFGLGLLTNILSVELATFLFLGIPCIILPIFTMYAFTYSLFKRPQIALAAAFLFSFNSFLLVYHRAGLPFMALAISLIPLALMFYINMFSGKSLRNSILGGLVFALVLGFDTRFAYLLGWSCLFYIPFGLMAARDKSLTMISRKLFFVCIYCFIPVALHAYWIIPLVFHTGMPSFGNYSQPSWVSALSFCSIKHTVALYTPFWGNPYQMTVQNVNLFFWTIPFFVCIGFTLYYKDLRVRYLLFISVISVILATGAKPPGGDLYHWLFLNLPGFAAFRDPSKMYSIISLGYSPLFGLGIVAIADKFRKKSFGIRYGYVTVIVLLCVLFVYPGIKDQMKGGTFEANLMPIEYSKTKDFLVENSKGYHHLHYPRIGTFSFRSEEFPYYGTSNTFNYFDNFFYRIDWDSEVLNKTNGLGGLWGFLNIKYIVLNQSYPATTKDALERVRVGLLKQDGIVTTNHYNILENTFVQSRFYMTSKTSIIVGGMGAILELIKKDPKFFNSHNINNIETIPYDSFFDSLDQGDEIYFYNQDWNDLVLAALVHKSNVDLFSQADWAGDNQLNTTWSRTTVPPHSNPKETNGALAYATQGVIECDMGEAFLTTNFLVKNDDEYEIWIRALVGPAMGSISLTVDFKKPVEFFQKADFVGYGWMNYGDFQLTAGRHTLKVKAVGNGRHKLDQVIVVKKAIRAETERKIYQTIKNKPIVKFDGINWVQISVNDVALNTPGQIKPWFIVQPDTFVDNSQISEKKNVSEIMWTKINPVEYRVSVNIMEPGVLVFAQTFDPGWKLSQNGKVIGNSKFVNGRLNGFRIDQTGNQEFIVEYRPQRLVKIGLYVSIITLVLAGFILIVGVMMSACQYLKNRFSEPTQ
ncbi:MAG: hypothetical protein ABIJ59_06635 [Pseudomonadota bacterium]